MRVLLVEDNKDTLASLAAVLRYEQYDVITAADGYVALEMASFLPPMLCSWISAYRAWTGMRLPRSYASSSRNVRFTLPPSPATARRQISSGPLKQALMHIY
jgi:DNA-binding NtrC family response regulator